MRELIPVLMVLALAGPALAQPVDPYWEIIASGTAAQSGTVQGSSGDVALTNTRNAYDLARGWNADGRPLSFQDVQAINAALRQNTGSGLAGPPGSVRTRQVVTSYNGGSERIVYPAARHMQAESLKLDAYLQEISSRPLSRPEAIRAAADVHSFIVQNHMFGDGNGRTARMMADTILMRNGLPPADYASLPANAYNIDHTLPAEQTRNSFRESMDRAVTSAEKRTGVSPGVARPGQPLELLGTRAGEAPRPTPELTARNIRARSFSPAVGVGTAAGLHVGGELVRQGLSGEGIDPLKAAGSLASWEFLGGVSGFILAERVAATAIGALIPVPGVGKLIGKPLAQAAIRGAAGTAGAGLTVHAVNGKEPMDWTDLAGSSVASGVGMAVGQALIPIPVVGAIVGGVVGGLIWDVGYGMWKKSSAPPRPGLPTLRGAPSLRTPKPGDP